MFLILHSQLMFHQGGITMHQNLIKKCITFLIFFSFIFIPLPALSAEKTSFMYLYGEQTQTYIEQINRTNGSINIASPNYFELDNNGNLVTKFNKTLTDFLHQKNIKVVPFLSNHWNRTSAQLALQNPQKLANDLSSAVINNNLDGVNIDLENLTYDDRAPLVELAQLLKNQLAPLGKTVSIAVGAVDKPTTSGWKSAYDLQALSNVVDYMIIMAYDQHWETSGPGPVAGLDWVKKQLDYMTTQVPKEKLVLGVPFYGRVWTNGQNGVGIIYSNTIKAAQENNAPIQWHPQYQSPFVKYTKADGSTKEIWFENARSLQEKLRLVNTYGLKGVVAWRLGQEDTAIWENFSTWLNGHSFRDIAGHWAENDILYLYNKKIVSGRDTYRYVPDAGVTRAEAVALLSRVFNWEKASMNPFDDVPNNHWAKEPILQAYNHSIIRGVAANKFGPEQKLTRAQLAVILQRAFDIKISGEPKYDFKDVPQNHWAAYEIYTLKNKGLVGGRTLEKYAPDSPVTRAELAAMVTRIIR
jgi:spore germination protein YaaH